MKYAKRTLNLIEYANNIRVQGEFVRFPLLHKALGLAVKYVLRLSHGTSNILLNAVFKIDDKDDPWVQCIKFC